MVHVFLSARLAFLRTAFVGITTVFFIRGLCLASTILVRAHLVCILDICSVSACTAISLSAAQSISPTHCVMAETTLESLFYPLVTMATSRLLFFLPYSSLSTLHLFANSLFTSNLELQRERRLTEATGIRNICRASESIYWE